MKSLKEKKYIYTNVDKGNVLVGLNEDIHVDALLNMLDSGPYVKLDRYLNSN